MSTAGAPQRSTVDLDEQLDFLRTMLAIRHFEDECHRLFAQGVVRGSTRRRLPRSARGRHDDVHVPRPRRDACHGRSVGRGLR